MGQTLQLSSNGTFVIVVFAISLMILAGVLCYIYLRGSSGRKGGASNNTIIALNNHRKSHLILFMDDDSSSTGPRYKSICARNALINSESESFTSIKISPSRPAVFGHEMDAQGIIRVVLTPPTPAKRKRRESLIDYESEDLAYI